MNINGVFTWDLSPYKNPSPKSELPSWKIHQLMRSQKAGPLPHRKQGVEQTVLNSFTHRILSSQRARVLEGQGRRKACTLFMSYLIEDRRWSLCYTFLKFSNWLLYPSH